MDKEKIEKSIELEELDELEELEEKHNIPINMLKKSISREFTKNKRIKKYKNDY